MASLLTAKEAREKLSVSLSMIYKLASERKLPVVKVGSAKRFKESDIDAYIERRTIPKR